MNSEIQMKVRSVNLNEHFSYCRLVCIEDWTGEGDLAVVKVLDRRLYCVVRREQTLIGMRTD